MTCTSEDWAPYKRLYGCLGIFYFLAAILFCPSLAFTPAGAILLPLLLTIALLSALICCFPDNYCLYAGSISLHVISIILVFTITTFFIFAHMPRTVLILNLVFGYLLFVILCIGFGFIVHDFNRLPPEPDETVIVVRPASYVCSPQPVYYGTTGHYGYVHGYPPPPPPPPSYDAPAYGAPYAYQPPPNASQPYQTGQPYYGMKPGPQQPYSGRN